MIKNIYYYQIFNSTDKGYKYPVFQKQFDSMQELFEWSHSKDNWEFLSQYTPRQYTHFHTVENIKVKAAEA